MSVYGYPRPTTPWLSSRRNDPRFLFFDDAYSCYVQTVPALSYALTAKNQYNDMTLADAPSLIEAAKAAGFHTVWISNQVRFSAWAPTTWMCTSRTRSIPPCRRPIPWAPTSG